MNKSVSPSRTYVAMCLDPNFKGCYFKKFVLPETDSGQSGIMPEILENNSEVATRYYVSRLDKFNNIGGCVSFEDISIALFGEKDFLKQLLEARRLLKNIKQDVEAGGYVLDITKDIEVFFEKYPAYGELKDIPS